MSTQREILDNLGEDLSTVEESAATVQRYTELRDREVELESHVEVYGSKIHRYQMVREEIDLPMGNDVTDWVVTGWDKDECTITLKVPGPWSKKVITFEELEVGVFEPLFHSEEKIPMMGY